MIEKFRENLGIFYKNYEKITEIIFFVLPMYLIFKEKTWNLNLLVTLDPSLH